MNSKWSLYGCITNLPSGPDKQGTEVILCIGVAYENIRNTGRAAAANAKSTYVEPTRAAYEKMLDDTESSFSQALADAHTVTATVTVSRRSGH